MKVRAVYPTQSLAHDRPGRNRLPVLTLSGVTLLPNPSARNNPGGKVALVCSCEVPD